MTEAETRTNTGYLAQYLKANGWQYVVVDICWYVGNDTAHGYNEQNPDFNLDAYARLVPAPNRFPSAAGRQVLGVPPLHLPQGITIGDAANFHREVCIDEQKLNPRQ